MKKRTMVGGLVVCSVVAGMFINGKLPGFGSGTGIPREAQGTAVESPEKPAAAATEPKAVEASPEAKPAPVETAEKPVVDEPKEAPKPPDFIDILVEDSNYSVSRGGVGNYRDLKLSQILTLAKMTTGNDEGLRVRILRKPSARYFAYATLRTELEAAGLDSESIRMPHDLVD
jgi:hypothetical protein